MWTKNQMFDGTEVIELPERASGSARKKYRPMIEPLEETGEFREWFRNEYGRDPVGCR